MNTSPETQSQDVYEIPAEDQNTDLDEAVREVVQNTPDAQEEEERAYEIPTDNEISPEQALRELEESQK